MFNRIAETSPTEYLENPFFKNSNNPNTYTTALPQQTSKSHNPYLNIKKIKKYRVKTRYIIERRSSVQSAACNSNRKIIQNDSQI